MNDQVFFSILEDLTSPSCIALLKTDLIGQTCQAELIATSGRNQLFTDGISNELRGR